MGRNEMDVVEGVHSHESLRGMRGLEDAEGIHESKR